MRRNSFIVWIVLSAVLIAVLNLPAPISGRIKASIRDGLAPLQAALSSTVRHTRERAQSIRNISRLMGENQKISDELVRLRNEVRHLKSLETENALLREQLHYAEQSPRKLISCRVIGRDLTAWWQTLRVSKGSLDGVRVDRAVITLDGVVGRVIDVSLRTSDVLLISDPTCKVAARITRAGSCGILEGTGPSMAGKAACRMDFINKNVPVQAGDEIVTSGLGGIFPPGLLVGYADKVEMDRSGLYQKSDVIPAADLGMLEYVFVVAEEGDVPAEGGRP